ncbi:hypothetical protein D3G39_21870 [Escherichia coli]|nr:hypothetical protein [Salmonella enterica]EFA4515756.1 hypothetical protein [Escherichia coli]EFC4404954.1 hypothetical protein [Escherichia coli]EFN9648722.1 hypothetical protein [Escherichia coli]EFN9654223.1 hypothetical protein [Escherichia coli]
MKVGVIRNKHAEDFRIICLLFIRLMSNVLKLFPFAMVMCSVVWFYFCPEHILSDIVNDWHDADTLEKIGLVRLYLKAVFILTVVSVVFSYLSSDKFMPVKRRK